MPTEYAVSEDVMLSLSKEQILKPEQALLKVLNKTSLNQMREALISTFSDAIVLNDHEPGKYTPIELIKLHHAISQVLELGKVIANIYRERVRALDILDKEKL